MVVLTWERIDTSKVTWLELYPLIKAQQKDPSSEIILR
jgi:hypothetical protein